MPVRYLNPNDMKNRIFYPALFMLLSITIFYACNKPENTEEEIPTESPCLPSGLKANTIAYYTFGNGSLKDISGNGNDLTNPTTASPGVDRSGNVGCAYRFNGSTTLQEYLTTSNTSFLSSLSQFSISLWYQPTDSARKGGIYEILMARDSTIPDLKNCPWTLALYDCRRAVFYRENSYVWDETIMPKTSGSGFSCDSEVYVRTGGWHHLVAVFDNNNANKVKLYRDGVMQSTTQSGSAANAPVLDNGDLFIGNYYKGSLDDIIIFNKALSQAEVNDLATMGTCCEVN